MAFCLPAITVGFVFDDLIHRLALEGGFRELSLPWWQLYDFTRSQPAQALIDVGAFPWFTSHELSLRLLRPVTSATLALDHALWGRQALPAHLHSLLWLGALVALAAALYRRWLDPVAARLASVLYAISGVHAIPTAWLAARHTLIAAVFSLLALWGWARWREDAWRPGIALTGGALLLSALASEAWLAGLVFLLLYEGVTRADWRARALGLAPFAAAGVVSAGAYSWLGYGIRGSGMYVSPLADPGRYLAAAAVRLPLAYAELFAGLPSIVGGVEPAVAGILSSAGLLLLGVCATTLIALRSRLEGNHHARWLALAAAATLSPLLLVGTSMSGRVLPLPMLGAAAAVAQALTVSWRALRRGTGARRYLALVPLLGLGVPHLLLSPGTRLGFPLILGAASAAHERVAREADLGPCAHGGRLYLLTAADPVLSLYLGPAVTFHTPEQARAERLRVLTVIPHDLQLTRVDAHTIELAVLGAPRRTNDFERLYRSATTPLKPGQSYTADELTARVLDTSNGLVTRVRFTLETPLDAPESCFIAWQRGRVAPVTLPAEGQNTTIPYERGPSGQ